MKRRLLLVLVSVMLMVGAIPITTLANEEDVVHCAIEYAQETILKHEHSDTSVAYAGEFASIRGYVFVKNILWLRDNNNYYSDTGIYNIQFNEPNVMEIRMIDGVYEVSAIISYQYKFDGELECKASKDLIIKVVQTNEGYKCVDIYPQYSMDEDIILESMEEQHITNRESQIQFVDEVFASYYQDLYASGPKQHIYYTMDDVLGKNREGESEEVSTRTSVSYNKAKAAEYGIAYGGVTTNYIFKRANPDCTNFVSQCVWAGYGGISNYHLPASPTQYNTTITILRDRVTNGYRMTSSWKGRPYSSTADPTVKFCGVVEFYDYVTTHTGNGPKGTGYNDDGYAEDLSVNLAEGDVAQIWKPNKSYYHHSVLIASSVARPISQLTSIYVSQHSSDYSFRPLRELVTNVSTVKLRLIKFNTATFSS